MGRIDLAIEGERDSSKKEERKTSTIGSLFRNRQKNGREKDDHVIEIYKDHDLHQGAKNCNATDFGSLLVRVSAAERATRDDILSKVSPAGNTLLHVAAKHGNTSLVTSISGYKSSLVLLKNINGETALHLAAKAGQDLVVRALVDIQKDMLSRIEPFENILRVRNERGYTALDEALLNGHGSIADCLIREDPELSYHQNDSGESALYLAAKAGFAYCVSLILRLSADEARLNELFKKKSPIQAAIQRKHRGVLEAMFSEKPGLIQMVDDGGRNPLHYAASLGHLEAVRYFLNQYAANATKKDTSGLLPIHLASIEGHVDVIRLLLQGCPYPEELLDNDGLNILHLAAMKGRPNTVCFILKNRDLEDLKNMRDKHGNTPLHLATMNWHPKIVYDLTWDRRVDIKVVNNQGMTALDVAESNMTDNPPFNKRLTWAALRAAGTPRSVSGETRKKSSNTDNYKERVNTLLLVSTLVATVTFAAGFTVPGGYSDSSDPKRDPGMATMLTHKAFHMFVFFDTVAMYSSILVDVALVWAQLGDFTLMLNALNLAVPLLGIALGTMSMAFSAGVFLVVSKLKWLGAVVLVPAITFIVALFLLVLPLCLSLTSTNWVSRRLSYYPFCFLLLLIGST